MMRRATPADAHAIATCLAAAFEPYRADYTPTGRVAVFYGMSSHQDERRVARP